MKHKFHTCKTAHPNGCPDQERGRDCTYDVLGCCQVCNLAEGELTTDCPGEPIGSVKLESMAVALGGAPEYTEGEGWTRRTSCSRCGSRYCNSDCEGY